MQTQRAILVNGSHLVRDLVKKVIQKNLGFDVIQEIGDPLELASAIRDINANWAFVIRMPGQEIPGSLKTEWFLINPTLRLVGLWVDGSQVHVERLAHEQRDLTGLTLDEIIRLLQDELDGAKSEGKNDTD